MACFSLCIGADPKNPVHYHNRAAARAALGQSDRALADLGLRPAQELRRPGQVDGQAVERHEAHREDVVGAWVEACGLDVDGEQPQVRHVGARPRERRREVVADRPGRCLLRQPDPPPVGAKERADHVTNPSG